MDSGSRSIRNDRWGQLLAELVGVFLEVALADFGVLVGEDLGHFFLGEAEAEDFEGVLGGLAVGEFFLAVGHLEEVHVVGVGEGTHNNEL